MKSVYKVEVESGTTKWFNEVGNLHRIEGPAIEDADGSKWWYLNGVLHREGGPAVEWADGSKWWCLNGKHYTEAEYNAVMQKRGSTCNGKIVEIDGKRYTLTPL